MAGANVFKFLINKSHSLANAPITIIINNTVEILFAIGRNGTVMLWYFVLIYKPIVTGIVVIRNIVNPKERILIIGTLDSKKCCIENPTIKGSVITDAILPTAV